MELTSDEKAGDSNSVDIGNNNVKQEKTDGVTSHEKKTLINRIMAKSQMWKDLEGDKIHVLILFFLYCLQGIPLGLRSSIPLILTKKNVPYTEQATFSISAYPFSMKVLWAPIIDSLFWAKFGKRKSWLVPVQYLIGITMLVSSQYVSTLLGDGLVEGSDNSTLVNETEVMNSTLSQDDSDDIFVPDVGALTAMFFIFYFLAATQDVVVDGWALTMLKPSNVGYASTCNSVGQQTGWVLGFVVFTSLESAGIVTLGSFMLFWGIVFLITTTGIAIFMKEKNKAVEKDNSEKKESSEDEEIELSFFEAYKMLWKIIRHPLMPIVMVFLFTFDFGFSAPEALFNLKLIEHGVPKDTIAQLAIPMIPVKVIVTFLVTKFTVGPRPLNVFIGSFPFRLLFCLAMTAVVYVAPLVKLEDGSFPGYYYALVIGVAAVHRATVYAMFVALMAFFARISDPVIGGTYMTFLNTFANLGQMWTNSFSLWFVDQVTTKTCVPTAETDLTHPLEISSNHTLVSPVWEENNCYGSVMVAKCKAAGGECLTITEGFYTMSVVWVVIGAVWLVWGWRTLRKLQEIKVEKWRVVKKDNEEPTKVWENERFKFFYCF